jgi:murein DD-endopeptidase MepM/ murein hydrolase activator NlpD
MNAISGRVGETFFMALSKLFKARDVFFHDGTAMRRMHVSLRSLAFTAIASGVMMVLALFGIAQVFGAAPMVAAVVARDAEMLKMHQQMVGMRDNVALIRKEAAAHAAQLNQRQAVLDAIVTGRNVPSSPPAGTEISKLTANVISPLTAAEAQQLALVEKARSALEERYANAKERLGRIGIAPARLTGNIGVGGPYEPVDATATRSAADPAFRALFQSWKKLDALQQGSVAIPSQQPVDSMSVTSNFGVRSDPFRGGAAMHAGIDIPGVRGSAIYATADGVVGRAGWAGGYGNLVELNHGRGIETRYGHLSAVLVAPGQQVRRGQIIGRMGSTGRSTGTHLHYEVRLDGQAVNPTPFLQGGDYFTASPSQVAGRAVSPAVGGPGN